MRSIEVFIESEKSGNIGYRERRKFKVGHLGNVNYTGNWLWSYSGISHVEHVLMFKDFLVIDGSYGDPLTPNTRIEISVR